MTKHLQESLPIEGFEGSEEDYFFNYVADSVDARVDEYIARRVADDKFFGNPYKDQQRANIQAAGRLYIPGNVFDGLRYDAIVHGSGVSRSILYPHNYLWNEVLDSTRSDIIDQVETAGQGFVLAIGAYDISRDTLITVLKWDHQIGEAYKQYGWDVNWTNDEAS